MKRHLADRAGAVWLRKKEIRERVKAIQQEIRQEDIKDFVVRILEKMAENDPGEWIGLLLDEETDSSVLREKLRFFNVTEFKRGKNEILELKFADRIAILEKLMKIAEADGENGLQEFCKKIFAEDRKEREDAF